MPEQMADTILEEENRAERFRIKTKEDLLCAKRYIRHLGQREQRDMDQDHRKYCNYNFIKEREDEKENRMLTITNAKEGDSLLVDLVKSYPHIYDKQNKDFKDIRKKNNSWQEIGNILGASASDCQVRWGRLRERYSREKKMREKESRSGSGSTTRPTFPLYEQMHFLYNFVKSRRSITNISNLKLSNNKISPNEPKEKFGSSNIPRNQNQSGNQNDYNDLTKASVTIASTSSSKPYIPNVPSYDMAFKDSPAFSKPANFSKSYESDDDFLSSMDTTITNDYDFSSSSQDLQTPPTFYKPNEATGLARSEMSSVSDITSETDKKSISPALSIDSSAIVTSNVPKRFKRETKHTSSADKVEESFLKLTSVVSSHFENKTQNSISFDMTDEDDIFGKTVACQLRKISEPRKSEIKGQLMKILFTT
ncbi:hypothetical protein PUN28_008326 [Cardiocondyla obscurior]|uniref:Transcription factor Adf-1 n=3 Tax=Cardiocondyla obscurior TaxID=286306 RepID=A0AAW2FZI6_9HYME